MSNYKILILMRIIKNTIGIFVNSFFVMYFLDVSNHNIFKLGIYYIIVYTLVYFIIYSIRNLCKSKYRINLLRIGIICNFLYFLLIILLNKKIVNYFYIMAIFYGIEEGFYFSVYNNFESTSIKNEERAKFSGTYTFFKSIIAIIVPVIFGSIITTNGFKQCTFIIVILVILQIICSNLFKDIKLHDYNKTNLKEYRKIVKKSQLIKQMYKTSFLMGFIYSGAFSSVVTIYIINVLNNSLDLGIFSSIFAVIICLIGLIYTHLSKELYPKILKISVLLNIIGVLLLIIKPNFVTVIIFNLFYNISSTIVDLIINNSEFDISNYGKIKELYKVEYFVEKEKYLCIGRLLGYLLYILLGIPSLFIKNFILIIFILILALLGINVIKLRDKCKLAKIY